MFWQYLERKHPDAEYGETVEAFRFIQPNDALQLHMDPPPQESGWIVNPDQSPMIVCATCALVYSNT